MKKQVMAVALGLAVMGSVPVLAQQAQPRPEQNQREIQALRQEVQQLRKELYALKGRDVPARVPAAVSGSARLPSDFNECLKVAMPFQCDPSGLYREALAAFRSPSSQGGTVSLEGRGARWMAALLAPSGPGEAVLADYFVHLAWSRLGQPERAQTAWTGFLERLSAWRERQEQQPPESAEVSLLNEIKARAERGSSFPEDAHLASVLGRRVLEPLTHYYKGTTAYLLGYPEEAVAELNQTLALLGDEANRSRAHYFLGRAYWLLGRPEPARAHLAEFLSHLDAEARASYPGVEASRLLAVINVSPEATTR